MRSRATYDPVGKRRTNSCTSTYRKSIDRHRVAKHNRSSQYRTSILMERGVPAPTDVKGSCLRRPSSTKILKARELDDDAFLARLQKMNNLESDITSRYVVILPTDLLHKLKEVVKEAQALHSTIPRVRDSGQPQQRNHLPTLIVVVGSLLILLSFFIISVAGQDSRSLILSVH
jgi:hypothetical protein